jgi:hypothetical protein
LKKLKNKKNKDRTTQSVSELHWSHSGEPNVLFEFYYICEYPKESRSIFSHQSVGFRFILVVEGVEIEMLFVSEETLAH